MESKGNIYISSQYTRSDYFNLKLCQESDDSKWSMAVDILRDRIRGRYLRQIDELSLDIKVNGFAIMALNCLLIETLLQFEEGVKETVGGNCERYSAFLRKMSPNDFGNIDIANKFYTLIRCGILHSAQTKEKSRLSDRKGFVACIQDDVLVVSVKGVTDMIKKYFDEYAEKLKSAKEVQLRQNFIEKMTFVCRE